MKVILIVIVILILIFNIFYFQKSTFQVDKYNLKNLYNNKFKKRFILNGNFGKLNNVDMVYCIAMPQRKQYATEQINKLNVKCKYFDAVKPADLSKKDYDLLSTTNKNGSLIYNKFTRLPVMLSFIMCFIDAIKNGYNTIIIFEDDIEIATDLNKLNNSLNEFNKSKFEAFYMGYCYVNCNNNKSSENSDLVEIKDRDVLCCHALCLKVKMLQSLIEFCFPMNNNSDEIFRDFYRKYNINVCVPKHTYFNQNRNGIESLNESYDSFNTCTF